MTTQKQNASKPDQSAFLENGGERVVITSIEGIEPALSGEEGTTIT